LGVKSGFKRTSSRFRSWQMESNCSTGSLNLGS